MEAKSLENTTIVGRLLSLVVIDAADGSRHRRRGPPGAEPALQPRIAALRRRTLRRRPPRPSRLLRPERLRGLAANGRSCADCHMATDNFQLSPAGAEARFQFLQWRRQWNPHADDPLFRPIDADDFRTNGDTAADFSNLRQNGLVRITFALPSNIRLIDPATNAPSAETIADVWRSVPTVNDVALTGPDDVNPWPRGPNEFGGYQLDARVTTLQEQALGALTNHAEIENAPPQRFLDDLASFQRVLFTNNRVRALADAIREGTTPLPDPDPPLNALEQARQGGVRARLHPVPRRPRTVERPGPGDSIPRHLQPVSAPRRHRDAPPASPSRPARRGSPAMRGRTRSRWRTARRSAARAPIPAVRC